ncbi:SOS response-associated peptidase [Herbiconiux ginsengi]|uniref:Abasic site processing protein n=1 Tax=Herbiconiux ginsengi TaxID=381665 RepID=A0A1H3KTF6_9MICO|nr:SOS response-associated peptidase [Herbiconiux ginsengi]SDY55452.1 Putative SOS response-associated peptidase YedK [Herbiconiux ginsengi]
MCGRFTMSAETDELITEFVARGGKLEDWRPSYNVAPTETSPIVRERLIDGELVREIDSAAWGLRPAWAKQGGPAPINARLESVATNGLFRNAFAQRRCIVPMNGYFEWEATPTGKQPHYIHGPESILAAAGLYELKKEADGWALSFTIITREAADASGEVHDRMPVFLTPDTWDEWTEPIKVEEPSAKEGLVAMLDRSSLAVARTITTYPVSKRVNNVRDTSVAKDDPTLIEPIEL